MYRIAKALDRDRTWVMLQAFSVYLRGEGGHILEEAEGVAQRIREEPFSRSIPGAPERGRFKARGA
jgi:hypothetical protein